VGLKSLKSLNLTYVYPTVHVVNPKKKKKKKKKKNKVKSKPLQLRSWVKSPRIKTRHPAFEKYDL
jgi:hypothetical protein